MRGTLVRSIAVDGSGASIGPVVDADYNPLIFNAQSIKQAKQVILYPDRHIDTEHRWEQDSNAMLPYLDRLGLNKDSWLLDYGCGIGRLAKVAITRYGCRVVGIDISQTMRSMAEVYVNSNRFVPMSAEMCDELAPEFNAAITVWTLQHCRAPAEDIAFLHRNLLPGGLLLVVNDPGRFVPVLYARQFDWLDDHQDVWAELQRQFRLIGEPEPFEFARGRVAFYQSEAEGD
jgi:SAM-dependent methyltransferase